MHSYSSEQITIEIPTKSGITRIGGVPGLIPTAMIGSIFYAGDKLVLDAKSGTVDKKKTEAILENVSETSMKTGIPNILDIVAETPQAMREYVAYLGDLTDMPLMIDGSGSLEVNLAGLETANELGLIERTILNSIGPEDDESVYQKVVSLGLKTAMLLAFNSEAMASSSKRVELAKILIERARKAGLQNVMVDTGVMDLLTLGTPQQVRDHIKKCIDTAGKGGGYIMANGAFFDDVKPENIKAMVEFTKEYGKY